MCSIQIYAADNNILVVLKHYKYIKMIKLACTQSPLFFVLIYIFFYMHETCEPARNTLTYLDVKFTFLKT